MSWWVMSWVGIIQMGIVRVGDVRVAIVRVGIVPQPSVANFASHNQLATTNDSDVFVCYGREKLVATYYSRP